MIDRRHLSVLAALAVTLTLASGARANLVITINGTQVAADPTNTIASFVGDPTKPINGFNVNSITAAGSTAFSSGSTGVQLDDSTLNISASGSGSLTILITETGLSTAGSPEAFTAIFSALMTGVDASRTFYLDPTNQGQEAINLGSVDGTGGSFTSLQALSGPYSLVEEIDVTATGGVGLLSADDQAAVPEPGSLVLLGTALIGLGLFRHRHQRRQVG